MPEYIGFNSDKSTEILVEESHDQWNDMRVREWVTLYDNIISKGMWTPITELLPRTWALDNTYRIPNGWPSSYIEWRGSDMQYVASSDAYMYNIPSTDDNVFFRIDDDTVITFVQYDFQSPYSTAQFKLEAYM